MIRNVIQNDMDIDTSEIEFHAVHRVGKKMESRCRPIIARFISREDRNLVWQHKGKIKHSLNYPDAYITEDFANAIQEERKVLIKAMQEKSRDFRMQKLLDVISSLIMKNMTVEIFQST